MARFVRTKRVTGPLGDKVRDQLIGKYIPEFAYDSSGSEHSGYGDGSPCLSDLVHGFLEPAGESLYNSRNNDSVESDLNDSTSDHADLIASLLRAPDDVDPSRAQLASHVSAALNQCQSSSSDIGPNGPMLRRRVMAFLRSLGHDAAICKAKWPSAANVTAGSYEFIDVIESDRFPQVRYIVDLDFAGQFEIARPSDRYSRLLQSLPTAYVGKAEDLKEIVAAMCGEAGRSLKSHGLHLPPWRKTRCMQNKWFGPYRRTANHTPATAETPSCPLSHAVKCRSVGFDAAVTDVNRRFFVAATSRAR